MKRDEVFPSKFFRGADLERPVRLTIAGVSREMLGQGAEAKLKAVMSFRNEDKRLVLNASNWDVCADAFDSDSDDWVGKRIVLQRHRVKFQGKAVWGLAIEPDAPASPPTDPTDDVDPDDADDPTDFADDAREV